MNHIVLLYFMFLLGMQESTSPMQGLWVLRSDSSVPSKTLLDIKNDSLYFITIGDNNTGEYDKVLIEARKFDLNHESSILILDNDTIFFKYREDSLNLKFPDSKENYTFQRIKPQWSSLHINPECFNRSYIIKGKNYIDSIDFINDSLLIYTGKYNLNFPAKKWNLVRYSGFNFLNVHDRKYPIIIVKSCQKDRIELLMLNEFYQELTLTPTLAEIHPQDLLGQWIEMGDSTKIPKPPGVDKWEPLYKLNIEKDFIHILHLGQDYKLKWALTNDGKRIYFPNQIFKNNGSWKILNINDNILTLRMSLSNGFVEQIVKLKKNNR